MTVFRDGGGVFRDKGRGLETGALSYIGGKQSISVVS